MAYTPINWQTGDTITAEKMNKMDNGWSVESSSTTYYSGSITTESWGNYSGAEDIEVSGGISGNSVIVTFDGTDYNCTVEGDSENGYTFGATYDVNNNTYDFTSFPFHFLIILSPITLTWSMTLATENDGTYIVTIAISSATTEVSDDFATAVNTVIETPSQLCIESGTTTWQAAHDVLVAGGFVYHHTTNVSGTIHQIYIAVTSTHYTIALIGLSTSNNLATMTFSASSADGVLTAS